MFASDRDIIGIGNDIERNLVGTHALAKDLFGA
jgi:hypothetical protein